MRGATRRALRRAAAVAAAALGPAAATRAAAQGAPAAAPAGEIAGTVAGGDAGEALPHSVVAAPAAGGERFTTAAGTFRLTGLRPGSYALRVRHIGYAPADTAVTVRAGERVELRVRLARLALQLAPVRVVAAAACTAPGAPDRVREPEFAALFDQLRENAEQLRLLAEAHPFVAVMERRFGTRTAAGEVRFDAAADTVRYASGAAPRYRPGRVVVAERWGARVGEQRLVLPTLLAFADRAFHATHCFHFAGADTAGGAPVLRVDFRAAARLRTRDVDGQIVLHAASYQIREMRLSLTRPPRAVAGLTAETRFREALPSIPVFDSVAASTTPRRRGRRDEGASRVEAQRLLELRFLRTAPGAAPPPR